MMINKQGLIFLTLTSLILVLSVYYITMPNELLISNNGSYINNTTDYVNSTDDTSKVTITSSSAIEAMRIVLDEERQKTREELNNKLTNKDLSLDEKNNVYEEIKELNKVESFEYDIENKIKNEFGYDNFVRIKDDVMEVVINSPKHDSNLAVKIMSFIEKEYKDKMYISVSFKE